jgi:hypothetical protein
MMRTLALAALATTWACGGGGGNGKMPDGNELRPDNDDDIDFDGVPNDIDNCPSASNAYQGNEDGDKFGDACDPCPIVADDNPPDADGDGVADACDPLPAIPGDDVKFFEGFHQGAPQGWDKAGTWSTSNDQLIGTATGDGHFTLIATDRTRETLTAKITVTAAGTASSAFGLADNKQISATSAILCEVDATPEVVVFESGGTGTSQAQPYELMVGQTYLVKVRRDNSTYTCTADRSGTTATATKTFSLANTPYQSGLAIKDATIKVDWFMVVESL